MKLRSLKSVAIVACALAGASAPGAAPGPRPESLPIVLDFEDGVDPVVAWASNGTYKVHFKGVTEEKAHSGRRSFKLDVELTGATYVYWSIPDAEMEERIRGYAAKTTLPRREWEELLQRAERIRDIPATLRELESGTARFEGMLVHALENPISSVRILPSDPLVPAPIATKLGMTAARGSFESASVIVQALRDLKGARLEVGDLRHEDGRTRISAGQMDVRIVKCWYQSPRAWVDISQTAGAPVLVPELLLHDDALVRVDTATQKNRIRLSKPEGDVYVDATDRMFPGAPGGRPVSAAAAPVCDASVLCPVDIPSGEVRQYWLTMHVPTNAVAGVYSGEMRVVEGSAARAVVPLRVTVLPFELPMPRTRHDPARAFISSIYYRGRLNLADFPEGTLTSEAKSPAQMRAELRDMFEHNIHDPAVYQPEEGLDAVLRLRNEAGMAGLPLFWVGGGTGAPRSPAALARLKERVTRAKALVAPFGVTELYMYGTDEARGDALLIQRDAWSAVHEAGAKVFVAGYKGQVKVVGDLLDAQIQAGGPDPDEVRAWHAAGHRIFCYANPQTGPENPEVFRRNYGFLLWKSDYDGAMTYAYQHGFGGIYDDADHASYRDHVFSYPTSDGVVPTLAIEGYREGIDDIRYATLLASQVARHAASPGPKGDAERLTAI